MQIYCGEPYFEFHQPEGGQIIRHRFRIKAWEVHWAINPASVCQVDHWPATFDPYLKSDAAVAVSADVSAIAKIIAPESKNPILGLDSAMDWLEQNMRYDHSVASLGASSEHALRERAGNCSDYHGLCAAFGRALGFPTRVCYGMNAFPKNSPSHCKLEAFIPPYGWVTFDVSETQKLVNEIRSAKDLDQARKDALIHAAHTRLREGFRDNTWFLQTRGTDYELAPPAAQRVPLVRTAYVEADGVALADPDPANPAKKEFAWMTVQKFTPDRSVSYPFKDWSSLLQDGK